jgi:hypothetical protein
MTTQTTAETTEDRVQEAAELMVEMAQSPQFSPAYVAALEALVSLGLAETESMTAACLAREFICIQQRAISTYRLSI